MSKSSVSVDRKLQYFRITAYPGKDGGLFGEKFTSVCKDIPEDAREYDYQGTQVNLELYEDGSNDGLVRGIVQQIRDNAPSKRKRGHNTTSVIDLEEDEGINEKTHFIYDPATSIICVEHNYHGPKIGLIVRVVDGLYKQVEKGSPRVSYEFIQTEQAIKRLQQVHNVRSVVARFTDPATMVGGTDELDLPEVLDEFKAGKNVKLEVKASSTVRGGVIMQTVDFFKKYLPQPRSVQVYDKLVVTAEDDTGKPFVIDLVHDKLEEKIIAPFKENTREVDSSLIFGQMAENFAKVGKQYIFE